MISGSDFAGICPKQKESYMKEKHAELEYALRVLIDKFEEETGFMVSDIRMNRAGVTSGYAIYGFYIPIVPKDS